MPNVNLTRQAADKFVSRSITIQEITMKNIKFIWRIAAVVAALLMGLVPTAASATVTLGKVDNGKPMMSAGAAKDRVGQHLEVDTPFTKMVARDLGVSPEAIDDAALQSLRVTGKNRVKLDSNRPNTGRFGGDIVTTDGKGKTVWAWEFKIEVEGSWKTFEVKYDCTNPLPRFKYKHKKKARIIEKPIYLPLNKVVKKATKLECPGGLVIPITVKVTVKGKFKSKVWLKVYSAAKLKVKQSFEGKVKIEVKAKCPPPPVPPGATPPPGDVICTAGFIQQGNQCVKIEIVCGVAVVNGGTVNTGDICVVNPPPPPPPPKTCIELGNCPPPPDNLPGAQITVPAHLFIQGNGQVFSEGSDPDGVGGLSSTIDITSGFASATLAGTRPDTGRWDGSPCPANTKCYRSTLWATSTPGIVALRTIATSGGAKAEASGQVQIKPEDGGPGSFDMSDKVLIMNTANPDQIIVADEIPRAAA